MDFLRIVALTAVLRSCFAVQTEQKSECEEKSLDLMVVLDGSSSVLKEFQSHQHLLLDILGMLTLGPHHSRVSLIQYAAEARVSLAFDEGQTRKNIFQHISGIKAEGGGTSTASAFQLATREFYRHGRNDSIPVLLLLNDGHSEDSWDEVVRAAGDLRRMTPFIFVLTLTDNVYFPELTTYSDDPTRVFLKKDIWKFVPAFREFLSHEACVHDFNPTPFISCDPRAVDIAVVFDRNVKRIFEKQKELALEVLSFLSDSTHNVRISVISLGAEASVLTRFKDKADYDSMIAAVDNMNPTRFRTKAEVGLQLALKELNSGDRNAFKSILFFTDGHFQTNSKEMIRTMREIQESQVDLIVADLSEEGLQKGVAQLVGSENLYKENGMELLFNRLGRVSYTPTCRFNFDQTTSEWAEDRIGPRKKRNTRCELDLLIILDTSGSTERVFEADKRLALDLVRDVFAKNGRVRVALVSFSGSSQLVLSFNAGYSSEAVISALEGVEYTGGHTALASAVRIAIGELSRYQSGNKQVVVLFSDGRSGDSWDEVLRTSEDLVGTGASLYAATTNPVYQVEELQQYIREQDRIFLGQRARMVQSEVSYLFDPVSCAPPPPPPIQPVFVLESSDPEPGCEFEVVIVLDTSGSVERDFDEEKQVALEILEALPIGPDATRVSIIRFSYSGEVRLGLSERQDKNSIIDLVRSVKFTGGNTDLVTAVNLAIQQLYTHSRPSAKKIAVLITDGNSKNSWPAVLEASEALKSTGATVYTVTTSSVYEERELRQYSTDQSRLFVGIGQARTIVETLRSMTRASQCTPTVTWTPPPASPIPVSGTCAVDLVVVLDTSGSVADEFENQRREVLSIVKGLPIGPQATRVALVTFHATSTLVLQLWSGQDSETVLETIRKVPFTGGNTHIAPAVRLAINEMRNVRSGSRQVFLLVSDGNSGDDWTEVLQTSKTLQDTGATTFAVTHSRVYSLKELSLYAGGDERVFVGGNVGRIRAALSSVTNSANCQPTPRYTRPPLVYTKKPTVPVQFVKDCQDTINLIIILDRSGSVKQEYAQQQELAVQLTRDYIPDASEVNVGVVSFADSAKLELSLSNSREGAVEVLKGIAFTGGNTGIVRAVEIAIGELNGASRRGASIVVLISDGNSRDSWESLLSTGSRLRELADKVYAASYSSSINFEELEQYTGSLDQVYSESRIPTFLSEVKSGVSGLACSLSVRRRPRPTPAPVTRAPYNPPVKTCNGQLDVVIVFDTSGSRTRDFEDQQDIALELVDVIPESSAVSLVTFADVSLLKLSLQANRGREALKTVIRDIYHTGGNTNLVDAVTMALSDFDGRRRSSATSVFILISDGHSQDEWDLVLSTSERVRQTFDQKFAVGLGQISVDELELYSGSVDRVYRGGGDDSRFLGDVQQLFTQECSYRIDRPGTRKVSKPDEPRKVQTFPPIRVLTQGPSRPPIGSPSTSQPDRGQGSPSVPKTSPEPCYPFIDFVVIFDSSGSVDEIFEAQKSIALDLLGSLPFPPEVDYIRLGLVKYSEAPETVIRLTDTQTRSSILQKITSLRYEGGNTATALAVQDAIALLADARPDALKVVLLMTDGHSQDEWNEVEKMGGRLRAAADRVFSLGVSNDLYIPELKAYAGTEDNIYDMSRVSEFNRRIQGIVNRSRSCTK